MSLSHQGKLVDAVGTVISAQVTRARARVSRDCWSTPRALAPDHVTPGIVGRPHGARTHSHVAQDIWVIRWKLGEGPQSPVIAGPLRGPVDMGPSYPGELVDTAGHRNEA